MRMRMKRWMKRCKERRIKRRAKRRRKRKAKTRMKRRMREGAAEGSCRVFKHTVSAVTAAEMAEPKFPLSPRGRTRLRCSAIC